MKKKILIVDDEPNIVVPLEFLMTRNNYDVQTADTGEKALGLILSWKPDLILLDIMLPGMDGYEVCQKIRQEKQFSNTRIIFLSAMARSIDIAKGMGLSADDYITKPFANDYVVSKIKNLLADKD
ncbi:MULTISPECIES: response regulator transcription factor [Desulfobacula]|uniref:Response regulator receiver protein n=2 Tax=Desulfobacula TaxID=28222 RepID=K0N2A7_DESTT|nr:MULTISPECIES: response regulator [Desulfobacula]CCK78284.1 response regulator receiver protein [Desulfobacula toluolica Tol2]SDU57443.1 Response regulator receiver domain-containing protein [Desulfobacula phenolica]